MSDKLYDPDSSKPFSDLKYYGNYHTVICLLFVTTKEMQVDVMFLITEQSINIFLH